MAALFPLRLALAFTGLTVMLTLLRGGGLSGANIWHKETKQYFLFYAAMCAGIPFAVHRGRTFDVAVTAYAVNILYFVMFLVHVNTWARFKRLLLVILVAAFVFSYFETTLGDFRLGRYVRSGSRMYDSNDVAFVGVSFLPFLLAVALGRFGKLSRTVASLVALSVVLLSLYTGSRGGFLGLVTFFVLFLGLPIPQVGRGRKMMLVACALVAALANIEKIDVDRFLTIASPQEDYNMSDEWGRKELWKRGIILFMGRPLTGVGADNFSEAIGTMRDQEGLIPKWQPSHNSFVQVLAETGMFGALGFFLLIVSCVKALNRLRRSDHSLTHADMGILPGVLQVGFIAQLVSAFFLTQAYSILLTLSFAVATSLSAIADRGREPPRA